MINIIYLIIMSTTLVTKASAGLVKLLDVNPSENEATPTYQFPFVPRSQWLARPSKNVTDSSTPVSYVVIHHSYTPPACHTHEECCRAMRSMQNFHMDDRGWWDIGYNFAIGSDGYAYEGRGWSHMGAHALRFNRVSIGICIIGDWQTTVPPHNQLRIAKELIEAGVRLGYIKQDYKLVGHRQVRDTECPGAALFEEIKTWKNYSAFPSSAKDLDLVPELNKNH